MEINELPSGVLIALATGHNEIARTMLTKLLKENQQISAIWLALSVTLPREQAIQALRRALAIEPGNAIALKNLMRVRETNDNDFKLSLSDIWEQENPDEEAPLLFENEQPTLSLRPPRVEAVEEPREAVFGEECNTLPVAFHSLLALKKSNESYVPAAQPISPAITTTQPVAAPQPLLLSLAEPVPAELPPPPVPVANKPTPKTYKLVESEPQPRRTHGLEKLPMITGQPRDYSPATYTSNGADSGSILQYQNSVPVPLTPVMPKLNTGPRPHLGMIPEPLFGLTGFGLVIILALLALLALGLVVWL